MRTFCFCFKFLLFVFTSQFARFLVGCIEASHGMVSLMQTRQRYFLAAAPLLCPFRCSHENPQENKEKRIGQNVHITQDILLLHVTYTTTSKYYTQATGLPFKIHKTPREIRGKKIEEG